MENMVKIGFDPSPNNCQPGARHAARAVPVLGIGLRLHIGSLAELLHRAQLRSANAAWQGADAAVLDRWAIEGPGGKQTETRGKQATCLVWLHVV